MRYEVITAYVMGIGLPALEVCRRGVNLVQFAGYLDDFLAGGLLLSAAILTSRRQRAGPVLLIIAWAMVCSGFYFSIVGQLRSTSDIDISGIANSTVVLIKGLLGCAALAALVSSSIRVVDLLKSA